METYTFQPKLEKIRKKIHQEKISFIPGKIELSNSSINSFFIFSQKKDVLIFRETETPKKRLIFSQKKAFLIFQERENQKKFSYISGNETFLYFRKGIYRTLS